MSTAARSLMASFAERTGLTSNRPPQRYLWTDAFAVCNFLGLDQIDVALALIEQVHHVLGRHRKDDERTGWLSRMGEGEGEAHPTCGGLRIGKKLPERQNDEPFDEDLEWERDGQYFHYLTKWMHALDQASLSTRDVRFNVWARELAKTAYAAFVRGPASGRSMCWKMSTDLRRPLVASMGQHDPLDGFVTCVQLQTTAGILHAPSEPTLDEAISDFAAMIEHRELATVDPLGLGGLLADVSRIVQLEGRGASTGGTLGDVLAAVTYGLPRYLQMPDLRWPASQRLGFRELGLAIGLHAVEPIERAGELRRYTPLARAIESFWCDHQQASTWLEHRDINEVMLATSLHPKGFVELTSTAPNV